MTPADAPATLDQLRGLHLPGGASGPVPGEILLALVLGFGAALLVGLLRVVVSRVRASVRRAALADLAGSRALAPPERILAQARLLRRLVRTLDGDEAASAHGAPGPRASTRVCAPTSSPPAPGACWWTGSTGAKCPTPRSSTRS